MPDDFENPWEPQGSLGPDWTLIGEEALETPALDNNIIELGNKQTSKQIPVSREEITMIGSFSTSLTQRQEVELSQLDPSPWLPSSRTFKKVALIDTPEKEKNIFQVSNFSQLLNTLRKFPDKSIITLNLITHAGSEGLIGLSGKINKDGLVLNEGGIDQDALNQLVQNTALLDEVRKKFKDRNSQFVIIACNAAKGLSLSLMQELAKTLLIHIRGFPTSVNFCLKYEIDTLKIVEETRTNVKDKRDCPWSEEGYKHLMISNRGVDPPSSTGKVP